MANGSPAEKLLRAALWEFGIRYRTAEMVGGIYPTLTVPQCLVVVFTSDCLTDRCPWCHPNRKSPKVWKRNQDFDASLRKDGWIVVRIWQHEIEQTPRLVAGKVAQIVRAVQKALDTRA